jgi:hypothetical protein
MSEASATPTWWSEPEYRTEVDSQGSAVWKMQLMRRDGERAHVSVVEDGSGGLSVSIGGSAGADIDLMEDGQSTALIMLHPRYLSPAGTDWNDRKRVWEAFSASGDDWEASNPGPNLYRHRRSDGATEIVTGYAEFTGRLVYAAVRRRGDVDEHRLIGAAKLERVLTAISSD